MLTACFEDLHMAKPSSQRKGRCPSSWVARVSTPEGTVADQGSSEIDGSSNAGNGAKEKTSERTDSFGEPVLSDNSATWYLITLTRLESLDQPRLLPRVAPAKRRATARCDQQAAGKKWLLKKAQATEVQFAKGRSAQ